MAKIAPNLAVERLKSTMAQNNMMRRARKKDCIIDVKQDLGNVLLLSQSNGKGYIIPTDDDVSPILHEADSLNFDQVMSPEFEFLLEQYNEAVGHPWQEIEVSNTEAEATVMSNVLRAAKNPTEYDFEGVLIHKYFTQGAIYPKNKNLPPQMTPQQVAVNDIPYLDKQDEGGPIGIDRDKNQFQYGASLGGCTILAVLLQLYFMYTKKGYNYLRLPAVEKYTSTRVFNTGTPVLGTSKKYKDPITYSIDLPALTSYVPNFKLISMVKDYTAIKTREDMTQEELEYARLVRHIGQLLNASYSPRATGAGIEEARDLFKKLGFTDTTYRADYQYSNRKYFFDIIQQQIQQYGYPVYISGHSSEGRHAFNITGFKREYDAEQKKDVNKYYVDLNYGPKQGNGWTQLEVISNSTYTSDLYILYNLNSINPASKGSGDVNKDERIDISDVLLVIDYINKKEWNEAHPQETPKPLPDLDLEADVNGDGEITREDVYEIVDIILGRNRGSTAEEIKKQQE